jgi:ribosomal-protein-alanine N-acetyltransferase
VSEPFEPVLLPLREEDLAEILELEAENPSPWSRSLWLDELRQRTGWRWVARCRTTGDLLGFCCGRTMADEAELFKLAVAVRHRRRGIAAAILDHAFQELRAAGVAALYLELRLSNSGARALYARAGFSPHGLRKNYYADPGEDALMMMKDLATSHGESMDVGISRQNL